MMKKLFIDIKNWSKYIVPIVRKKTIGTYVYDIHSGDKTVSFTGLYFIRNQYDTIRTSINDQTPRNQRFNTPYLTAFYTAINCMLQSHL